MTSLVIAASAFAQGQVLFTSSGSYIWNTNSARVSAIGAVDVGFIFSTSSSAVAGVEGIGGYTGTPTNTANVTLTSAQNASAWTALLTDPNFQIATNTSTSSTVVETTSAAGGLSGSAFTLGGTSASGGTIYIVAFAWQASAGSDPWAAQAAGASLGWSKVFSYGYVAGPVPGPTGTPVSLNTLTAGWQFGVLGVSSVPEPSTMALAALGGASLLLFRRRSSK